MLLSSAKHAGTEDMQHISYNGFTVTKESLHIMSAQSLAAIVVALKSFSTKLCGLVAEYGVACQISRLSFVLRMGY